MHKLRSGKTPAQIVCDDLERPATGRITESNSSRPFSDLRGVAVPFRRYGKSDA